MAYSTRPRTTFIYKDFEPAYEWSQEQNFDTLLIYLPDFKKEEVNVQIDNYGKLRVEGERRLERNQRLRFSKDFEIPDNCNVDDIRANFTDGLLYIWLPKLIIKAEPAEPEERKPNDQKKETDEKQSTSVQEELEKTEPEKDHERDDDESEISKEKEKEVGNGLKKLNGPLALEKSLQRKLLINVVVALMVLVALGMYVTFKMSKS